MNQDTSQKLFQQTMEMWIEPEIDKRKSFNRIPDDFKLKSAQIIFSLDRGWNKVRLNEEVKAIAKCKVNCAKKKGDSVYEKDIDEIESIDLTEKDPNCAHITLLLFKNNWVISFDFMYNKKRINQHIEAAKEFLDSAKENLEKKRLRPFFENSFACAELSAKAVLLQLPDKEILQGKNHETRINRFKNWANLGNVKQKHSHILERLNQLRSSARYLCSTEFKNENPEGIISKLNEMITFAESRIK
ncbi:MAG: HEPN domain-containing protein [Nanoarchaeota archaeon]|nr:HEPN domain-containing protein [Nanoarchaeota archaeon]MBU1321842.1 HEPN domain-containing protein [Nanoarchaeota archaeon]MBU1597187.1 HEPN domain-containing protein [Nanoarchaeota archaeon]MBU2441886.1 HEPN domain-containing protein [Nanoarchaeota archaeon]